MNLHEAVDVASVRLSALAFRDAKLFARRHESPPLVDVAAGAGASVDDPTTAGVHEVAVETPVGTFEAAYRPWQWRGPEHPTLLFHHGSGERPFDLGRLSTNSFRRLFVGEDVPANLVAVRAPFHDRSTGEYARALGDLENFVGMLAASVGLIEALATGARARTDAPVVAAGISLGGWAVNLHRACFDGVDVTVPMLAGAAPAEVFVASTYRHLVAASARRRPAALRDALDFEAAFDPSPENCRPLLARHDRIVEFDSQRPGYGALPVTVLEKGHTTGALATGTLRYHVLSALSDPGPVRA